MVGSCCVIGVGELPDEWELAITKLGRKSGKNAQKNYDSNITLPLRWGAI